MTNVKTYNMLKIILTDNVYLGDVTDIFDTGTYFNVDDTFFPSDQWTDFAYPILVDWANILMQQYQKYDEDFQLYFMDGGFRLDLEWAGKEKLKVDFVNFRKEDFAVMSREYTFWELLDCFLDALKELAKLLEKYADKFDRAIYDHTLECIRNTTTFKTLLQKK